MSATLAPDVPVLWQPHSGPQTTFLASPAYEALYGGAAGGGKSDALLFGALRQIEHSSYKALILRRTFPELLELMDRAREPFAAIGGQWNEQKKRWTFASGATVQFGYCESYVDVLQYQGQQFTYVAFDELGQIAEERIWTYLMSRNRAAAPNLVKQMRASANPGGPGHHWIQRRFISVCPPDGELVADPEAGTTRAFVQAFLSDNPTLLEYDPEYAQRLKLLPELEYRWLALGDWDAGAGLAFAELDKSRHLVAPHAIPDHWTLFGAFDWGYQHPFAFGLFGVSTDGAVCLIDSCMGRHKTPPFIADDIHAVLARHGVKADRLRYIAAGHDIKSDIKARGEQTPTLREQFTALGLPMILANIARVAGVQNLRRYLMWQTPEGEALDPRFTLMATATNKRVWDCLTTRVSDPDNPEDVLKTDADERGDGGDDAYDMVRYGLASRPIAERGKTVRVKEANRALPFDYEKKQFVKPTYDGQSVGATLEQMTPTEHRPRVPRWPTKPRGW